MGGSLSSRWSCKDLERALEAGENWVIPYEPPRMQARRGLSGRHTNTEGMSVIATLQPEPEASTGCPEAGLFLAREMEGPQSACLCNRRLVSQWRLLGGAGKGPDA